MQPAVKDIPIIDNVPLKIDPNSSSPIFMQSFVIQGCIIIINKWYVIIIFNWVLFLIQILK